MRRRPDYRAGPADDDGLQADVMRFMAIIAFCLVAIMALARNATPLDAPVAVVDAAVSAASPTDEIVEAEVVPSAPRAVPAPAPVATRRPPPAPPAPQADEADDEVAREVAHEVADMAADEAADETVDETVDEGLSLRFASDADFLRLVSRAHMTLYAFRDAEVLALVDGARFLPAPAPGRVHELLAETVPSSIRDALGAAREDAGAFRWGVRMPAAVEVRIRAFVDEGASGELVIDRYGEVRLARGDRVRAEEETRA
ncbi:MAG TPA: hypothetical protein VLA56_03785 [Pseudomonadales bacterium]|nr:hypothetical protein [Pseudomonadales bacterium]